MSFITLALDVFLARAWLLNAVVCIIWSSHCSHLCGFARHYHVTLVNVTILLRQAFDVVLCWKLDAVVLFSLSIRQRRHSRLATFLKVVCWYGQRRAASHLNFGSANCVFGANASRTGCAQSQHLRVLRSRSSWFGWHVFAPKQARLCTVTYCVPCFAVLWIVCKFLVIGSLNFFGTFQSASCSRYFSYSSCRADETQPCNYFALTCLLLFRLYSCISCIYGCSKWKLEWSVIMKMHSAFIGFVGVGIHGSQESSWHVVCAIWTRLGGFTLKVW